MAARGFVDGTTVWLDRDVVYLRDGAPTVYGREPVRVMLARTSTNGTPPMAWEPLGGALSADGRSGYTYGIAVRPSGNGAPRLDRYIAYWQRDRAGPWRIAAYVELVQNSGPAFREPLSGLDPPARRLGRQREAVLDGLRRADVEFAGIADREGLASAFAARLAPDGVMFNGTELVVGPRAVREHLELHRGATSTMWHPRFVEAAASADLGFTVGDFVTTGRGPTGAAVQQFGKYLTIWRRQPAGAWRLAIEGGNRSPGPQR